MNKKSPKRIVIIGTPGSGKSTLATRLGKILDIPVHHLDTYVFVNNKKTDKKTLISIQKELVVQNSWIIEGCSISTLDLRFEKADMVIYLDFQRIQCIWRVLKRYFYFDNNLVKSGCIRIANWTLLKYIWNFENVQKLQIFKLKKRYPEVNFHILQSTKQVEEFLNSIFAPPLQYNQPNEGNIL